MYLPAEVLYTRKLVQRIHVETFHGGVSLTMTAVREQYWIPTLRQRVKSAPSACWGCKRFKALLWTTPPPGPLVTDSTNSGTAFEVIETDFAGAIKSKQHKKREGKAYLAIFTYSFSRAVHLELMSPLERSHFITCLKRLIAQRDRTRVTYSGNGETFIKTEKWLRQLRADECLHGILEGYDIAWKLILSGASWWGGQFERLTGTVKSAMYKVIEGLPWTEPSDVLPDVETNQSTPIKLRRR